MSCEVPGLVETLTYRLGGLGINPEVLKGRGLAGSFIRSVWTNEPWFDIDLFENDSVAAAPVINHIRLLHVRGSIQQAVARAAIFTIDSVVVIDGLVWSHPRFFEHIAQRLAVPMMRARLDHANALLRVLKAVRRGYSIEPATLARVVRASVDEGFESITALSLYRASGGAVVQDGI